ncbi:mCG147235 [Mus musculus]|nr:mCG147235 [Mus musculus]
MSTHSDLGLILIISVNEGLSKLGRKDYIQLCSKNTDLDSV